MWPCWRRCVAGRGLGDFKSLRHSQLALYLALMSQMHALSYCSSALSACMLPTIMAMGSETGRLSSVSFFVCESYDSNRKVTKAQVYADGPIGEELGAHA